MDDFRVSRSWPSSAALRGTPLDIFGRSEERRTERRLIGEYEALLEEIISRLSAANHATAVELAALPLEIRGFGHVKQANLARAKAKEAALLVSLPLACRRPGPRGGMIEGVLSPGLQRERDKAGVAFALDAHEHILVPVLFGSRDLLLHSSGLRPPRDRRQ